MRFRKKQNSPSQREPRLGLLSEFFTKKRVIEKDGKKFVGRVRFLGFLPINGGEHGSIRRVRVNIGGMKKIMAVKMYRFGARGVNDNQALMDCSIMKDLQGFGFKTLLPEFMIVRIKGEEHLLMPDLTENGRYKVYDYVDPGVFRDYKGHEKLNKLVEEDKKLAGKAGYELYDNSWCIVVDEKNKVAKGIYLVDLVEVERTK